LAGSSCRKILCDNQKSGQVVHKPQTRQMPFSFEDVLADKAAHKYQIVTVDAAGHTAKTDELGADGGLSTRSETLECGRFHRQRISASRLGILFFNRVLKPQQSPVIH
jgi:hypothetical protein